MQDAGFTPKEIEYRPTLRDQFAMAVLSGALLSTRTRAQMVREAFAIADEALAYKDANNAR